MLISACSFRASTGAYLEGELTALEIVPKKWNRTSLSDLHFRIIPAGISADLPTEVLAGARMAAIEAQFDRNPNVRFAAQHFLQSLKDVPVSHAELEGMSVQLHFRNEGQEETTIEGTTDRNGEIWFQDVSETAICSLSLKQQTPPPPEESRYVEPQARHRIEITSMTAEPAPDQPLEVQPGSEPQIIYLADKRIVVLLEEIVGGGAVLTWETNSEEFGGAKVRFEWGNERGEGVLEPGTRPGTWNGQRKLNQSFKDLQSVVPTFEVIPRQHED